MPRLTGSRWLHSARAAGSPIDWAPSPTFHKLQTKVNFFFIRRGKKKKNQFMFELGKLTCWIIGRHALSVCLSHALKLLLPRREEWGEKNGSRREPSPSARTWAWSPGIRSFPAAWTMPDLFSSGDKCLQVVVKGGCSTFSPYVDSAIREWDRAGVIEVKVSIRGTVTSEVSSSVLAMMVFSWASGQYN